jgi:hypothetical protein
MSNEQLEKAVEELFINILIELKNQELNFTN